MQAKPENYVQFFFLSKVAPWDTELRIMRADCHENMGDYINAISDIK